MIASNIILLNVECTRTSDYTKLYISVHVFRQTVKMSLLKSKDVECTPVMFSAAAKAAISTGKRAVKIAGDAAVEIAKDAGLKNIKRGPKNMKQPSGAGARSISGGSRRQSRRKRADMSERNEAIRIRREQLQQEKENEQTESLQRENKQKEQRRKQSAAAMREIMRM